MHPIQDLFLEGFSYVLQIDMHFICTSMWTKFYSCKKWVLHRCSWQAGLVACPPSHHLALNQPLQVGEGPIHPYKYPPRGESRHTTLIL
jgi:hypothetical protein